MLEEQPHPNAEQNLDTIETENFHSPKFLKKLAIALYQKETDPQTAIDLLKKIGREIVSIAETGEDVEVQKGREGFTINLPQRQTDKDQHREPDYISVKYQKVRKVWYLIIRHNKTSSSSEEHIIAFNELFPQAEERLKISINKKTKPELDLIFLDLPKVTKLDTLNSNELHKIGELYKEQIKTAITQALAEEDEKQAHQIIFDALNKLAWEIEKMVDEFAREDNHVSFSPDSDKNIHNDWIIYCTSFGSGTAGERVFLRKVEESEKTTNKKGNWLLDFPTSSGFGGQYRRAFQAIFEDCIELSKNQKAMPHLRLFLDVE